MTIKVGSTVRLKSGGPDMTVEVIFTKNLSSGGVVQRVEYAACGWIDDEEKKRVEDFSLPSLELIGE